MRQIILDIATTGLELDRDHRIIELAVVELRNGQLTGRTLHTFLDPERDIDAGAEAVHGIRREDLIGMPRFTDVAEHFLEWIRGSELVMHNAPLRLAFLNAELTRLGPGWGPVSDYCTPTCITQLAREHTPGIRTDLHSLCDHYGIDHGANLYQRPTINAGLTAQVLQAMQAQTKDAAA